MACLANRHSAPRRGIQKKHEDAGFRVGARNDGLRDTPCRHRTRHADIGALPAEIGAFGNLLISIYGMAVSICLHSCNSCTPDSSNQHLSELFELPSEHRVVADCPKSEQGRGPSRFHPSWRRPENRKLAGGFWLQPRRQGGVFPPVRNRFGGMWFQTEKACFARQNRPYCSAKQAFSECKTPRFTPCFTPLRARGCPFCEVGALCVFLAGRVAVCPPYMLCASSG